MIANKAYDGLSEEVKLEVNGQSRNSNYKVTILYLLTLGVLLLALRIAEIASSKILVIVGFIGCLFLTLRLLKTSQHLNQLTLPASYLRQIYTSGAILIIGSYVMLGSFILKLF
jgi:hypothetical protein